jgi:hypothetical protein
MKGRISHRDLELLSAYLDDQLGSSEEAFLKARLQTSSELRLALQDLRMTRQALRAAPRIKTRHRFTLTPEMARIRPKRRIYPVFQFATAIASLLFVIVLLGDLFQVGTPASLHTLAGEDMQARERVITVEVAEAEKKVVEAPAPAEGAGASALSVAPTEAPTAEAFVESAPLLAETLTETARMPEVAPAAPAMTATVVIAQPVEPTELTPTPFPPEERTEFTNTLLPALAQARQIKALLRITEIFLAVLALGLGVAAIYSRRIYRK